MEEIPVFLVLASPILHARLRSTLARAPGIRIVGEAASAASASEQVPALLPRILLTERHLLREPALQRLLAGEPALRVVIVTLNEEATAAGGEASRSGTVSSALSPPELALRLRQALMPGPKPESSPPWPRAIAPGSHERFRFTGPVSPPENEGQAVRSTAPISAGPVQSRVSLAAQGGPARRRTPSARHERLVLDLHSLQHYDRDTLTGLVGPGALSRAWALLPGAQQTVAFLALEVQDSAGKVRLTPPESPLLRRISATLRANARQEDLVCRAGPATFILLLPGLRPDDGTSPLARFGDALAETCAPTLLAGGVRLALGVGYWESGQEPIAMLVQCLQVLRISPGMVIGGAVARGTSG